ncbi:MAG: hypothetical protein WCC99_22260 [Candidatus Sulfotelmatobacter sp.]
MSNQHKRDQWLHEIAARQRNIVFPNTLENETRFWRNLGTGPAKLSTTLGLGVLAIFVFSFAAMILIAMFKAGALWRFIMGMVLFCGSIFGTIAWATRRSLRSLEKARRDPTTRKRP